MRKTEIERDDSCVHRTGTALKPDEYPFYDGQGRETMIYCEPTVRATGLTEYKDGEHYGVVALAGKNEALAMRLTASELRAWGQQMLTMADHLDEQNG